MTPSPGSPTEPGLVEQARAFIREWARNIPNSPIAGELDHLANASEVYLKPLVAALRSPLPDREGKEDLGLPGPRTDDLCGDASSGAASSLRLREIRAEQADIDKHLEFVEDSQMERGLIARWNRLEEAARRLNTGSADGAERVQLGAKHRDDLNSTSHPSDGDALKEALEWYRDQFCEDSFHDLCGHHEDCAGCRAYTALSTPVEQPLPDDGGRK